MQTITEMTTRKAVESSDVSSELAAASIRVGIHVMVELCQRVVDGLGLLAECVQRLLVLMFLRKGDVMS